MVRLDRDRQTVSVGSRHASQTETIIAGIIIGAALLVGFFIVSSLVDVTPATEETTVTNESVGTVVFDPVSDNFFYTVDANGTDGEEGFLDNEQVFNTTSDTQLTEGTDYEWFPDNGTVRIDNTSAVGNNSADTVITYTHNSHMNGFQETVDRIGDGFLVGGVVIIVLFAAVILRVLRGL